MNLLQKAAHAERDQNRAPRFREIKDHSCVTPRTHGYLHELNLDSLRRKEGEALAQLNYWRANRARSLTDRQRLEALARITIWSAELTSIQNRIIEVLNPKP